MGNCFKCASNEPVAEAEVEPVELSDELLLSIVRLINQPQMCTIKQTYKSPASASGWVTEWMQEFQLNPMTMLQLMLPVERRSFWVENVKVRIVSLAPDLVRLALQEKLTPALHAMLPVPFHEDNLIDSAYLCYSRRLAHVPLSDRF